MKHSLIFFTVFISGFIAKAQTTSGCTDFSGYWAGTCYQDGVAGNSPNLSYQQKGCKYLVEGINGYDIGQLRTVIHKNPTSSYTQEVTLAWNPGNTRLNQSISIKRKNKTTGEEIKASESGYIELTSPTQMHVILVGTLKTKAPHTPETEAPCNVECFYTKQ